MSKVQVEIGDAHKLHDDNDAVTETIDGWPFLIHEAAHCLIGHRLNLKVKRIEICYEEGGYSFIEEGSNLTRWLTMLLSGERAEVEFFGRQMLPRMHARSDRERLYQAVVKAGRMGEQALFVARQQAPKLVRIHRGPILQLSHDLLALVHQAQGADVVVEGDELVRLLGGPDVAILRLAANG